MTKRTGAKSIKAIDPATLQGLNDGSVEAATLSEALAVDFSLLMASAFPQVDVARIKLMRQAKSLGITKRMHVAAALLSERFGEEAFDHLSRHPSDTVRGWAAYALAGDGSLSLDEKLCRIRLLADDSHFCVREWAWLALRPCIAQNIADSIACLIPWAGDSSENIRRFAIEATRPRGVWSKHIAELKSSPQLGEPLLNSVMEDPSRYVQNACANWLNDAGKSQPVWVTEFCEQWQKRSQSEALTYVIRRALRSVKS